MGVLTELVIASIKEADDVARDTNISARRSGFNAQGLDQIKLSTLRGVVTNREYEDSWIDEFCFVAGNQEDGPWVFSVPDALISALASFPESRLKAAAKQWSRTEEFKMDAWSFEEVETMLRGLYRFFKTAKNETKSVLMRVSI
jgi:hypothetical protein